MPVGSIAAFWGVALLLIIVPGVDWAFTISAGLRGRSVLPAVGGLVLGYAGMTAVVAAGVGTLVARNPGALTALTVLGGCYLVWHGVRTVVSPASPIPSADHPPERAAGPTAATDSAGSGAGGSGGVVSGATKTVAAQAPGWATLLEGIGVSGLNPKGLLIFVALLPQFADPGRAWPMAVQLSVLGLVFVVTCAVFYLALGSLTRTVLNKRPAAARVVSRISGVGMILIGAMLIIERITG